MMKRYTLIIEICYLLFDRSTGQIISLFVYLMVFKDTFNKISVKNRGGKFYW
jgi:hypothetical protein